MVNQSKFIFSLAFFSLYQVDRIQILAAQMHGRAGRHHVTASYDIHQLDTGGAEPTPPLACRAEGKNQYHVTVTSSGCL